MTTSATPSTDVHSETNFEVRTTNADGVQISGQVTIWPHETTVYVSQPQRPQRVEGTDRFATLCLPHGEDLPRRYDAVVTDDQYDQAADILTAFSTHADHPALLADAREHHVRDVIEKLDRFEGRLQARIEELTNLHAAVRQMREQTAAAADGSGPLPNPDTLCSLRGFHTI